MGSTPAAQDAGGKTAREQRERIVAIRATSLDCVGTQLSHPNALCAVS